MKCSNGFSGKVPTDKSFTSIDVYNSSSVCKGIFSNQLSLPIVANITSFPIQRIGSIVHDLNTNTLWYSDGTNWIPINAVEERNILDSITIYINASTGEDNNDGLSSATAVASIQRGLNILSTYYARNGILQLQGSSAFMVSDILDFYPASSFIGNIIIRGEKFDSIQDNVALISGFGPFSTWNRITGVNGGYNVGFYSKSFVHNETNDGVYVIKTNTAVTIDTIVGDIDEFDRSSYQPPVPWNVGDRFSLFTTQTRISFTGILRINNPHCVPITFEYVHVEPLNDGDQWKNPLTPVVTFRGCIMDSRASVEDASYAGSMNISGCFTENTLTQSYFTGFENNACVNTWSFWSNGPTINYGTCGCFSLFLYLTTNVVAATNVIGVRSSDFFGLSILAENIGNVVNVIYIRQNSSYYMKYVDISATCTGSTFTTGDATYGYINQVNLTQASSTGSSLAVGNACNMFALGQVNIITAGTGVSISGMGYLLCQGNVTLTSTSPNRSCIIVSQKSSFHTQAGNFTCTQTVPSTVAMFSVNIHSVFNNSSTTTIMSADTSGSVITVTRGSMVSFGNNSLTLTNTGSGRIINAVYNSHVIIDGPATANISNSGNDIITCSMNSELTVNTPGTLDLDTTGTSIVLRRGSRGVTNRLITNSSGPVLECGSLGIVAGTTNNDIGVGGIFEQCIWYSGP